MKARGSNLVLCNQRRKKAIENGEGINGNIQFEKEDQKEAREMKGREGNERDRKEDEKTQNRSQKKSGY